MYPIHRVILAASVIVAAPAFAATNMFTSGNLVVSVEGAGVWGATTSAGYTTNQAAPLTLMQFSHNGTASASYAGSLVLPSSISGEYGSSSEGFLHTSADGRYLTVMGYGVNAAAYNANPAKYGTAINNPAKPTALGQSGSLTADRQTPGSTYTPVARVVATIDMAGNVDTSTQLYNIFNGNNPRSAYTIDGSSFYVSGQGLNADTTGGVFYAAKGASSAAPITGRDTSGGTANQDTRDVTIRNGQLYVSVDSKGGSNNARSYIGTLGDIGNLPTSIANNEQGPTQLNGFGTSRTGKYVMTSGTTNGVNMAGQEINLSPEQFFFANDTTLYVADSGAPKNDSVASATRGIGNGGLQKWMFENGAWTLKYTLATGLNLVNGKTATSGTTGLFGLAGVVNGNTVELYATNYTVTGVEQTYLYGISDQLGATANAGQSFTTLAAAPINSTFKGVSFAQSAIGDVPEPASWAMFVIGFGAIGRTLRRQRPATAIA